MYVDDLASSCIHVRNLPLREYIAVAPDPICSHVNLGTGTDVTIGDLAYTMAAVVIDICACNNNAIGDPMSNKGSLSIC